MKVICPFCGVGCNLELYRENGKIHAKVAENPEVNGKNACIKGLLFPQLLQNYERLKKPLIRIENSFEETSWRDAISLISEKLETYSKNLGVLCSGKILNEEAYLAQKLCRMLGTNNIDTCARLCHAASEVALSKVFGYGATSICWNDLDYAETILMVGENMKFSHPVLWNKINKKRKNKDINIIVADAGKIVQDADVFLKPKPGTDVVWLCGVAKILVENKLYDKEFIKKRTIGFKSFVKSLNWCTPEFVEKTSGIKWDELEEVAKLITNRTIFIWGMGLTQHPNGTKAATAIASLALLTGNIGKPGCGVAPLRGQNNVQGVGDMGANPVQLPGHYSIFDEAARKHFESFWNFKIPEKAGISATQMIHSIAEGKIKSLYIIGENPVLSEPQSDVVRWMLSNLDFLVVQDIFLTETAKMADVVLPAAMIGEKEGTCINAARRIQLTEKFSEPPGNAMEDWKIIQEIARKLGEDWHYRCAEDVWNEVRECVPIFSGASYENLRKSNGLQWPVEESETKRLYQNKFAFPDGKARFHEIKKPEFVIHPVKEFPFILTTCRLYEHFNTGEMTLRIEKLKSKLDNQYIYMSKEDLNKIGAKEGSKMWVHSPYGSVRAEVRVAEKTKELKGMLIQKGVIVAPIHFFKYCNFNRLMSAFPLDPESKTPPLKAIPVSVQITE